MVSNVKTNINKYYLHPKYFAEYYELFKSFIHYHILSSIALIKLECYENIVQFTHFQYSVDGKIEISMIYVSIWV